MNNITRIKDITDWEELFDMTYEYISFLLYDNEINDELVIKATLDMLNNCGYPYSRKEVAERFYELK